MRFLMNPQLAKRTACDRCRGQKLSCSNAGHGDPEPCVRCRRAGSECVTSTARPLGRPRVARYFESPSAKSSYRFLPPNQGRRRRVEQPSSTSGTRSSLQATLAANATLNSAGLENPYADPSGEPSDLSWLLGHATASPMDLFLLPGEDPFSHLPCPPQGLHPLASAQVEMVGASSQRSPALSEVGHPTCEPHACRAELMVRLAHINEAVTNQLLAAATFPALSALSQAPQAPALGGNHISEALGATSDFIDLIRGQQPATSVHPSPSRLISGFGLPLSPGSSSSDHPTGVPSSGVVSLSTPAILLILSGYMQLLQLYDIIFRRAQEFLQMMPSQDLGKCPGGTQAQFSIAGIKYVDGRLKVRIVVQVIEHQLDTVGRLLGLPPEFCLSDTSPSCEGVLSHAELCNLVQAVMGDKDDAAGGSAKEVIQSLRDAIRQVKALIS